MKNPPLLSRIAIAIACLLGSTSFVRAQEVKRDDPEGPVTMVLAYNAKPEKRVAFLTWMKDTGVNQFEAWKKGGVFKGYQVLASAFIPDKNGDDVTVVLNFARYADTAKWREVEKTMPGGLPPQALAMAVPAAARLVDTMAVGGDLNAKAATNLYFVIKYQIKIPFADYPAFALVNSKCQFDGQLAKDIIAGYAMYLNQSHSHNSNWDSLYVVAFKDIAQLANWDTKKEDVRAELEAKSAEFKKIFANKGAMRSEVDLSDCYAILPQSH